MTDNPYRSPESDPRPDRVGRVPGRVELGVASVVAVIVGVIVFFTVCRGTASIVLRILRWLTPHDAAFSLPIGLIAVAAGWLAARMTLKLLRRLYRRVFLPTESEPNVPGDSGES